MLAVLAAPASAEPSRAPPAAAGYLLPETEMWDMSSAEGGVYRILVSRPSGPAKKPSPVLYVLDGNAMFAALAEARRIQSIDKLDLDKMIIVGIGYPSGEVYDGRRLFDLTVASVAQAICNVDQDSDIDKTDLSAISRARGQTAQPGDPRDANGDGLISPADLKVCIPLCTRPNCAVQ